MLVVIMFIINMIKYLEQFYMTNFTRHTAVCILQLKIRSVGVFCGNLFH